MAIAAATLDAVPRPSSYDPSWSAGTTRDSEPPLPEMKSEMSFWDFLDVINPLQHIPIVGSIYREITGDTINPASSVMGSVLFGGPIGGLVAVTNEVIEQSSGKDVGGHLIASLGFGDDAGVATAEKAAGAVADRTELAQTTGQKPAAASWATPSMPAERAASAAAVRPAPDAPPSPASPATSQPTLTQPTQTAQASLAQAPLAQGKSTAQARTIGETFKAGNDPFAAPEGGRRPSRMPARDTILANTTMARHPAPQQAAASPGATTALAARFPSSATVPTAKSSAGSFTVPAAEAPATATSAAGNPNAAASAPDMAAGPAPVAPELISETMMRNLAKYEQSRKAAQNAAPSLRVSG